MYLVNTINGNHSTSFEFAGLYLSFFEKDYQNYPQFYLNGLKYCAESAKLQNKNELVEDYTNLGINFLVHNKNQDHNEILFFLELDAETKFNLGKFNESILSYKKLMLEYIAKGIDDLSRISQCKFFMASSYLNLGLYQNAKELFEEILNSEKKEDDFILLLSKLSVYQCLVLSNKFDEALKFSENLDVELKKKFGKVKNNFI
jgi:tetratricopeptide (TPR) repeat protein